jgi:heptosyltransferase-2
MPFVAKVLKSCLPKLDFRNDESEKNCRTVVLVNLDSIGDCILFSSVIMSARKSFPLDQIILVTLDDKEELFEHCKELDELILIKNPKWLSPKLHYCVVNAKIYLTLLLKFRGKIFRLLGPGWLLFSNWTEYTNGFLQSLMNKNLPSRDLPSLAKVNKQHQVMRMLDIAGIHGVDNRIEQTRNWLQYNEINSQLGLAAQTNKIVIAMGSGHPRRSWPTENFIELINLLRIDFPDSKIVVVGNSKQIPNVSILRDLPIDSSVKVLIDQTNLRQVKSFIVHSSLVISNDSGIAHLAASEGKFVVVISSHSVTADIWHLHSPKRYSPWGVDNSVIQPDLSTGACTSSCVADGPHCIKTVKVCRVWDVVNRFLSI